MSNKIIPFWALPAHWGLKGKTREIARAEYKLEGEHLDRALAKIMLSGQDYTRRLIEIDKKYGLIDEYEYGIKMIEAEYAGQTSPESNIAMELKKLAYYKSHGRISDHEYEKKSATLRGEGWVKIIHVDVDGSFEFDWNDLFIDELEAAGFGPCPKAEMVVDQWFNEICKNITLENFQGDIGLIEEQAEERQGSLVQVKPVGNGKKEIK